MMYIVIKADIVKYFKVFCEGGSLNELEFLV